MLTPSHGRREGYRNLDLDGMDDKNHTFVSRRGVPPPAPSASAVGDIQKLAYLTFK